MFSRRALYFGQRTFKKYEPLLTTKSYKPLIPTSYSPFAMAAIPSMYKEPSWWCEPSHVANFLGVLGQQVAFVLQCTI